MEPPVDFGIRPSIKHSRFIKDFAREDKITLGGKDNKEVEGILEKVTKQVGILEESHADFLGQERQRLAPYLGGISEINVRARYDNGLRRFFKQQYRLYKKESPGELQNLSDEKYLNDGIIAYSFDFLRTLHIAQRLGVPAAPALQIAERAYMYNPDLLLHLTKRFPDFPLGYITYAATQRVNDPEGFLENVKKTIPELRLQFSEFPEGVISRAAINYSSPEDFLTGVRKKLPELKREFSDFGESTIISAAAGHSDPAEFLRNIEKKLPQLRESFSEFEESHLLRAAVDYSEPDEFLTSVRQRIPELQLRYSNVDTGAIISAIIHHPSEIDKFLHDVEVAVPILETKFPEFKADIRYVAVRYYPNSEDFLQKVSSRIPELQRDFSDFSSAAIAQACIYSNDPEKRLQDAEAKLPDLQKQYPSMGINTLRYLAARYSSNKALQNRIENILKLKNEE